MDGDVDWAALGNVATVATGIIAVIALLRTIGTKHDDLKMAPFNLRLQQLEANQRGLSEELRTHANKAETASNRVLEEIQNLAKQLNGMQVGIAREYATKADLEQHDRVIRNEIDLAGKFDKIVGAPRRTR